MNIFYLDKDVRKCAEQHCKKHSIKMILEYAQLLCTAHRYIDGEQYIELTPNNRKVKRWKLSDERENVLYKATHINHPSTVWTRSSDEHYKYVYNLFVELCNIYTERTGKTHLTETKLKKALSQIPTNIKHNGFVEPTPAMPDYCKKETSLESYRNYYIKEKQHLAEWYLEQPNWFKK